jgi:hypothetical protein
MRVLKNTIFCFFYIIYDVFTNKQCSSHVTNIVYELIENLKEKNTTWSNTMLDCERSVSRTLFLDENSDRSH